MAGLPSSVVERSEELMKKMQKDFSKNLATKKQIELQNQDLVAPQLNLF